MQEFINSEFISCYKCGKELSYTINSKVMRNDECEYCYASLHSCRMCEYYDRTMYNECKESQAERITEKEKANFCSYFKLAKTLEAKNKAKEEALSKASALFKF